MPLPSWPERRPAPPPAPIPHATLVESPACHFCLDARQVLAEIAATYPMVVDRVDVRSDLGRQLMAEHRATMSPLVLLDGVFFSHGRLPRRKLVKLLEGRYGAAVTDAGVGGGEGRG